MVKCGSKVNTLYLKTFPGCMITGSFGMSSSCYRCNTAFEVLFGNGLMALKYLEEMKATFAEAPAWGGGSFWMRKRGRSTYAKNRND
jgi:hypothetical protein